MEREAEDQEQITAPEGTLKVIVQPESGIVPVVQAIRTAKRCIDICIFRFDRAEIEKALGASECAR